MVDRFFAAQSAPDELLKHIKADARNSTKNVNICRFGIHHFLTRKREAAKAIDVLFAASRLRVGVSLSITIVRDEPEIERGNQWQNARQPLP